MLAHTLVPLDSSDLAETAVAYARQIIPTGGSITLLTVLDISELYIYHMYPPVAPPIKEYRNVIDRMKPQATGYLERVAEPLREAGFEVQVKTATVDPATVIVRTAVEHGVDAIVMATHGRSGLSRWLFGSITQRVLNATACPVLVVPATKLESENGSETTEAAANSA